MAVFVLLLTPPDFGCPDRESTLGLAAYLGLEELVAVLLDHGTGSYPGLGRSLFVASRSGAMDVVNLLLRYRAQVNVHVDLKNFAAMSFRGANTALGIACENGHLPVAKVLIENGAKIDDGFEPSMRAAASANKPIWVDFLLKEGVNVNARDSRKQTALHNAAWCNSADVAKLLLDAHCDLDLKDDRGKTALLTAVSNNSVDVVILLLDVHYDLDLKDIHGRTPLHHVASYRSVDAIKLLLDAHCDLDLKDDRGKTALLTAVSNNSGDVVKLLLDAHCDLDLKDVNGWTPLHSAAFHHKIDVLELLLERGGDASAKDKTGKTARNLLKDRFSGKKSLVATRLLTERGKREQAERLVQRLIQLEQKASAASANEP